MQNANFSLKFVCTHGIISTERILKTEHQTDHSELQFVNHLFIIAIQIQKSFAIISDTTDKEDAAAAELRNPNRFIIINIPIHLINERKRTMKKTIRKIGANLLAIGVTAAGMSSIPASAATVIDKFIHFQSTTKTCLTYVVFTPQTSYHAVTYTNDLSIVNREVYSRAQHRQGMLEGAHSKSYQGTAFSGFYNIPSSIHVQIFYSEHFAQDGSKPKCGVTFTI